MKRSVESTAATPVGIYIYKIIEVLRALWLVKNLSFIMIVPVNTWFPIRGQHYVRTRELRTLARTRELRALSHTYSGFTGWDINNIYIEICKEICNKICKERQDQNLVAIECLIFFFFFFFFLFKNFFFFFFFFFFSMAKSLRRFRFTLEFRRRFDM